MIMGFGILRGQKCKLGDLKGMSIHIEREKKSRSNLDIDREKTKDNYEIIKMENLNQKVKNRIAELPGQRTKTGKIRRIQNNAVMMYDFIITGTHEDIMAMSAEQQKKYFEAAVDFIAERYGRENIMYAVVHVDERTPHLHLGLIPVFEGKLAAYKLFTPDSMRKLQDDFYDNVSSFFGLDRGEIGSKQKHKTAVELKSETLAEVNQLKLALESLRNIIPKEKKKLEELKKSCVCTRVMRDDYVCEAELNFRRLEKLKAEADEEKKELESVKNQIAVEREKLDVLKNVVKVCSDDKELKFLVDIIKANDKTIQTKPLYDCDGQMVFENGKPKEIKVGGALSGLTVKNLVNLLADKMTGKNVGGGGVTMYEKKTNLDDWNLLSEAEKEDRKAHQAFDNY